MLRLLDGDRERTDEGLGPPRQDERQRARQRRDDEPFGDDEAHQPAGGRAERRANAHVALALDGAGEQQVRDVEARQQEDETDNPHADSGGSGQAADLVVALPEHPEARALALVGVGPVMRHHRDRGVDLPLHVRGRRTVLQPAHHEEPACVAFLERGRRAEQREVVERQPDVRRVDAGGPGKRFGDHAADADIRIVQAQGQTSDGRRRQLLAPEALADRHGRRPARDALDAQLPCDHVRVHH